MRIWVTGAAGFLGRRLVAALGGTHEVVALSRRPAPGAALALEIDLTTPEAVGTLAELPTPDVVVHAACRLPGAPDLAEYVLGNVLTTARLLDALDAAPPRRLVFTSTLSVYGHPVPNPVSPDEHPEPSHPYGATKRTAEQLVEAAAIPERVVVRLPSLYGVGQEDSFVHGLARTALAGEPIEVFALGRTLRDALHGDDAVQAVVRAIEAPLPGGFVCVHAGVGRGVSTAEWAAAVADALGSSSEVVPIERASTQAFDLYADVSAARRQLAFEPRDLGVALKSYADELRAAH